MDDINIFLKQYYKDIKNTFPVYGKKEKTYLQNFQVCIQDYIENNNIDNITSQKIMAEFGTPVEIIVEYLSHVNNDYLIKNIRRTSLLRKGILTVIFILIASLSYRNIILYLAYEDAKNYNISHEIITIEEE